tara:strand:+ start:348 stop:1076 length:729 start_codon:yes stop_codon:yes gene_type:complete
MNKKFIAISGAVALMLSAYASPLMAFGISVGGTLGAAHVEASGQEYMNVGANDTVTAGHKMDKEALINTASAHAELIVGESYFGENNGFALGYRHYFGEGSVEHTKDQGTRGNLLNGATTGSASGDIIGKAKLDGLNTVYLETPGVTPLGIFLKIGQSSMDVTTNETVYTGATYGNTSVDGDMWGFGFKKASEGGLQFKIEVTHTDWDPITLTNSDANAGANKIQVDSLDTMSGGLSIAYVF